MKTSLRNIDDHGVKYQALMFACPGCAANTPDYDGLHMLPVNTTEHSPSWDWDGNLETPTLSPSILTKIAPYVDGVPTGICHSFLRNGVFEFLSDSTHPLSGSSVTIPDLPKWAEEMA